MFPLAALTEYFVYYVKDLTSQSARPHTQITFERPSYVDCYWDDFER